MSLAAIGFEWLIVAGALWFAMQTSAWWAYVLAFAVIATRQHALLMLFHDAVHGLLARRSEVNDGIINAFVGVPTLLPVEVYRTLHLAHHHELGTPSDPERTLLYVGQRWNYEPLTLRNLLMQIAGDLLLINGIRTIHALGKTRFALHIHAATGVIMVAWIAAIGLSLWFAPRQSVTALLLWFGPLVSLTQLLQKLRSFAEHSGGPGRTPGWPEWTYTWRIGLLGRLTIWPYNINLHLEHHQNPAVPWHELPMLAAATREYRSGTSFWSLLHKR